MLQREADLKYNGNLAHAQAALIDMLSVRAKQKIFLEFDSFGGYDNGYEEKDSDEHAAAANALCNLPPSPGSPEISGNSLHVNYSKESSAVQTDLFTY